MTTKIRLTMLCLSGFDCFELGLKILLFLVYESYEISRCRNQNLEITTKATKFLGDLEITTKSEILRWTNHTNPETLSPTNSHHETFSKCLAVLGLSKIFAILEGSEQLFPRKRSLGAPDSFLLTENISTSSAILNSRTLSPQIRSRERKFEQRLARGLFWSRLSNLITIPDWPRF